VLKADGLAAGKGVVILTDLQEAKTELKSMLVDAKFALQAPRWLLRNF